MSSVSSLHVYAPEVLQGFRPVQSTQSEGLMSGLVMGIFHSFQRALGVPPQMLFHCISFAHVTGPHT